MIVYCPFIILIFEIVLKMNKFSYLNRKSIVDIFLFCLIPNQKRLIDE